MKCLEKDRRKRYRSARELADDLARFLDGESVSAVRSGLLGRMVGAMDRVQLQERFASFGTILLALAPVMAIPEILVAMIFWNQWPTYLAARRCCCRVGWLSVRGESSHSRAST